MTEAVEESSSEGVLTAHETVYRRLRGDIAAGQIAPGTRLVQRKLATRMGTSTIPIIDALRRLEGEGLLITTPGVGTHVRRWQPEEIEEVYMMRSALEGVACRFFAQRATLTDLAMLEAYNEEFEEAVRSGSLERCRATDERLHFHIARASRSSELFRLIENSACVLLTIDNTMFPPELSTPMELGPSGVHAGLVQALKSRDPEKAEEAGRRHVRGGYEQIEPYIARMRSPRA